ncbi:MAG: procyclic acidic repetitive family protein [Coriobacteriales bacterium]|nr:procyclic acidic repetitive family protein [Coriobacteriales bacterium]
MWNVDENALAETGEAAAIATAPPEPSANCSAPGAEPATGAIPDTSPDSAPEPAQAAGAALAPGTQPAPELGTQPAPVPAPEPIAPEASGPLPDVIDLAQPRASNATYGYEVSGTAPNLVLCFVAKSSGGDLKLVQSGPSVYSHIEFVQVSDLTLEIEGISLVGPGTAPSPTPGQSPYQGALLRLIDSHINLRLTGANSLTVTENGVVANNAAISVPGGSALTIAGEGSLAAQGGTGSAAIGAGAGMMLGSVSFTGGNTTAAAGSRAAAIGGGMGGAAGGDINISYGVVTATADDSEAHTPERGAGAAIGGAFEQDGCTVTITGGKVTATGQGGAAIGGGASAGSSSSGGVGNGGGDSGGSGNGSGGGGGGSGSSGSGNGGGGSGGSSGSGNGGGCSGGTLNLRGGEIRAIGQLGGAAIGGGGGLAAGDGGNISISGVAKVTAEVQSGDAAAIGGGSAASDNNPTGNGGNGGSIAISGSASISASIPAAGSGSGSGSGRGAAIGGGGANQGSAGASGQLSFSGGITNVSSGQRAAAIGGGGSQSGPAGEVNAIQVSGGIVNAQGSDSSRFAIGSGSGASYSGGGTISISAGIVDSQAQVAGIGGGDGSNGGGYPDIIITGGNVQSYDPYNRVTTYPAENTSNGERQVFCVLVKVRASGNISPGCRVRVHYMYYWQSYIAYTNQDGNAFIWYPWFYDDTVDFTAYGEWGANTTSYAIRAANTDLDHRNTLILAIGSVALKATLHFVDEHGDAIPGKGDEAYSVSWDDGARFEHDLPDIDGHVPLGYNPGAPPSYPTDYVTSTHIQLNLFQDTDIYCVYHQLSDILAISYPAGMEFLSTLGSDSQIHSPVYLFANNSDKPVAVRLLRLDVQDGDGLQFVENIDARQQVALSLALPEGRQEVNGFTNGVGALPPGVLLQADLGTLAGVWGAGQNPHKGYLSIGGTYYGTYSPTNPYNPKASLTFGFELAQ